MAPMTATQARKLIGAMQSREKVMKTTSALSVNTAAMGAMYMKCNQCGWTQPVLNASVGSGLMLYEYYCLECGGQVFEIAEERHALPRFLSLNYHVLWPLCKQHVCSVFPFT